MWPGPGGPVPGPGGPVPVARSRCPVPVARSRAATPFFAVARSRSRSRSLPSVLPRSGFGGPVARSRSRSRLRSALMAVARSRSRSRSRWPGPGGPVPVARVPVPIKRITYAVWPASMSPGMDAQSLPGIWLFYAVLQTTGERQTILRSRNHYRTKTGAKRLPKPTA